MGTQHVQTLLLLSVCVSAGLAVNCKYYFDEVASRPVGRDVCHQPFAQFIKCLTDEIEKGIQHVIAESSPAVQREASQCFQRASCSPPAFEEKRALDTFLPCKYSSTRDVKKNCIWRHAANVIIDILKSTPKKVGSCMIRFFKGIGQRKIEQCTREYPPSISPPLIQPAIPGFEDFEIDDLKNVLLYHVMTRYQLGKCTGCSARSKPALVTCLADQAKDTARDVCDSRQDCEGLVQNSSPQCWTRYNNVRQSICSCAKEELKKGLMALDNWGELKKTFTRGDLECQMEDCYKTEGLSSQWPSMAGKLKDMKTSVVAAILKLQRGDAPPQISEALVVFKSILDELVSKWSGIFCGDCTTDGRGSAKYLRRQSLVTLLNSEGCKDAQKEFNLKEPSTTFSELTAQQNDQINDFFG